jgi:hypothetical protein
VASATPAPAAAAVEVASGGVSPEVTTYLEYMEPKIQIAGQAIDGLGQQQTLASTSPSLLSDATWRAKTGVALAFTKNAGEEIQKYEPVLEGAGPVEALMVALGQDLVYVADEYDAGLETRNARRLINAVRRMNDMTARLPRAAAEIKALRGQ